MTKILYDQDDYVEWPNIFEGKSVAIVGNAQSLFLTHKPYGALGYGEEIDGHDIVLRMNRAAMLYTRFDAALTHGTRTDVWFVWRYTEYLPLPAGVIQPPFTMQVAFYDDRPPLSAGVGLYPSQMYIDMFEHMDDHDPSTGLCAIEYVLSRRPRRVSVYGFDWKKTPTFTDWNRETPEERSDASNLHDFAAEKDYCIERFMTRDEVRFRF